MDKSSSSGDDPLEILWGDLLSRQPQQIRQAYSRLTQSEQQSVQAHLHKMVSEPGWHAEQRASAKIALKILS